MTKYEELIQITKENVQSLKSQINMCVSYITFGDRTMKTKYRKQKDYLQKKLDEQMYWLIQYTMVNFVREYLGGPMKVGQYTNEECKSYLSSNNVKII